MVFIQGSGRQVIEPRPLQLQCAAEIQDNTRVMILKARQIGWTELIKAYLFWKSWFHDDQWCLALSRRLDPEALLIIQGIKFGYNNLPQWMRDMGPKMLNDAAGSIKWDNGSYVDSDASKDNPARGRTLSLLVMDEFGKFPNPDDAWASALPATEFGQLIVLGNANGYGTRWWSLATLAKSGLSDFIYRFFPWTAAPKRTKEWLANVTSTMKPSEIAAEYPDNDEDCWIQAGDPVYDIDTIRTWETEPGLIVPIMDGSMYYEIWEHPQEFHSYVIGADIALGGELGDNSIAQVLDIQTGKHVAKLKGKCDPTVFADLLDELGRKYNNALLAPEVTGRGHGVVNRLREDLKYPKLYIRREYNKAVQMDVVKYGWDTNRLNKYLIIDGLFRALSDLEIGCTDGDLFMEMQTYRHLANGQMGGLPHDDEVMSMGIAVQVWRQQPRSGTVASEPKKAASRWAAHDGSFMDAAASMMGEGGRGWLDAYLGNEEDDEDNFVMNSGELR